jgi:hypothetical protein
VIAQGDTSVVALAQRSGCCHLADISEASGDIRLITTGNATTDSAPFRGWFVGDLTRWAASSVTPPGFGLRDTTVLEVKWGLHPAGQPRPEGWAPVAPTIGLSVLVSGEFAVSFRAPGELEEQEAVLREQGDYVMWDWNTEHTWRAIRDSIVLTVRWPAPHSANSA